MPELLSISSYVDCHGCSLCLLPCPMWRAHRDIMFSPQGIAKAMQSEASAEDLRESVSSCIMCGACDTVCPENIDLIGMIAQMWSEIALPKAMLEPEVAPSPFVMSCDASVQAQIGKDDLYVIDAAPFHVHYAERVTHYDDLRKNTGCSMNLDLNRVAIPTGTGSAAEALEKFDVKKQVQWLVQGRDFKRVIVENRADMDVLREITGKPVFCISELLGVVVGSRGEHAAS
ncbi:MAG: 4Fe-4S dicluster domain-containing protein [Mariprofundaceae bacterium]|nr:4Fe-4S dicluster domain-containing protein [Mariprofundaceae bacterium]